MGKRVQAPSHFLSGYVCHNDKAVYSACGPQVDVFLIDRNSSFLQDAEAVQNVRLVEQSKIRDLGGEGDFGGLRHGGHVRLPSLRASAASIP